MPLQITPYEQQVLPRVAGTPKASAPFAVNPMGRAIEEIGGTVREIGAHLERIRAEERKQRAAVELQDRVGKASAELAALELRYEEDQDFATAPDRFKDDAGRIQDKYLDGVTDQGVALAFRKQYEQLSLSKWVNVVKSARGRERDYFTASLDANLDTYAKQAANAKNPAEADLIEQQARLSIAAAEGAGYISSVDAGKRERAYLARRDGAMLLRDMSMDPMLTAQKLSLDPQYAPNIGPVERERWTDQAIRRSSDVQRRLDAEAEKERKRRGDELMKQALGMSVDGTLTRQHADQIRDFIEPAEYKSLLASLAEPVKTDDPGSYSTLESLIDSDPEEARRQAFLYHRNRLITNGTLNAFVEKARSRIRQEGPRSEYERSRQYLTNALKPSEMVMDPAASARHAIAIREFEDFAAAGKRTDQELREKADDILKRQSLVDMVDLARKTSAGVRNTPEDQLEALRNDAARLQQERSSNRISEAEYQKRMKELNNARVAAERARK